MREIVIPSPRINNDNLRGYSYHDGIARYALPEALNKGGINPTSHPNAVDLCAGGGSWARLLVDNGWEESNLTCIDRLKSLTPLVPRAKWLYWDLEKLSMALLLGEPLPAEVVSLRYKLDMVFCFYSPLRMTEEQTVCEFLIRHGGHVFNQKSPSGKSISPWISSS